MTQSVIDQLKPHKMHIIPCHMPPHKSGFHASNQDRSAMLVLAFKRFDCVSIDARELNKTTLSYTVETVREIRKEVGPETSLCFLLGQDSWGNFSTWHCWREILREVNIVIVRRPGSDLTIAAELVDYTQQQQVPLKQIAEEVSGKIAQLSMHSVDLASRSIRTAVADGKSIEHMVSSATADYIQKHQLYI